MLVRRFGEDTGLEGVARNGRIHANPRAEREDTCERGAGHSVSELELRVLTDLGRGG